jgi:hypothetical protein
MSRDWYSAGALAIISACFLSSERIFLVHAIEIISACLTIVDGSSFLPQEILLNFISISTADI